LSVSIILENNFAKNLPLYCHTEERNLTIYKIL
jgi:hypothetical protein